MKGFPQALQVTVPVLFRIASWIFRKFVCLTMWSENWSRLWKGPAPHRLHRPSTYTESSCLYSRLGPAVDETTAALCARYAPCRQGSWAP